MFFLQEGSPHPRRLAFRSSQETLDFKCCFQMFCWISNAKMARLGKQRHAKTQIGRRLRSPRPPPPPFALVLFFVGSEVGWGGVEVGV